MTDYIERRYTPAEVELIAGLTALATAVVVGVATFALTVASLPDPVVVQGEPRAGVEGELKRCVAVLQDTQNAVDFWRQQALAMRTDGIDNPQRKVPEKK
jgi:hypothetical protein